MLLAHCFHIFRRRYWPTLCWDGQTTLGGNLGPVESSALMKPFLGQPAAFAHSSYNGLDPFKEFHTVILLL